MYETVIERLQEADQLRANESVVDFPQPRPVREGPCPGPQGSGGLARPNPGVRASVMTPLLMKGPAPALAKSRHAHSCQSVILIILTVEK